VKFHWLRLRATAHPTEVVERVESAIKTVAQLDLPVQRTEIETHHGATQVLLAAELKRQAEIRATLQGLLSALGKEGFADLERRLDDDGILYLRADKQEAFQGRIVPGLKDPVAIQVKVEVHPFSRERAMAAWVEYLA